MISTVCFYGHFTFLGERKSLVREMDKLEIELAKERSEHERVRSELAEVESECREARVHNHSLTIGLETANLTVAKLENQVTSLKYQIGQEHEAKRKIGECIC